MLEFGGGVALNVKVRTSLLLKTVDRSAPNVTMPSSEKSDPISVHASTHDEALTLLREFNQCKSLLEHT